MKTKLLITGKMRSGTTFLANFLNSQDGMVVYADYLRSIFTTTKDLNITDFNTRLSDQQKNIFASNIEAESKAFRLQMEVKRTDFDTILELLNFSFNQIAKISDENNVHVVGVKKTEEIHSLESLLASGFKIIYIMRDPRDVLLSSANRFANFNLFKYTAALKKSISVALELKDNSNFLLIRYENLMLHPKQTSLEIGTFLQTVISTDLDGLQARDGIGYLHNSSFGDVSKLFDQNAIYRWKTNETNETIFAGTIFCKEIDVLGYEKSPKRGFLKENTVKCRYYSKRAVVYIKKLIKKIID